MISMLRSTSISASRTGRSGLYATARWYRLIEEREQVQAFAGAMPAREIDRDDLDSLRAEQIGELGDARIVRPVAAAGDQGLLVEPEAIASLHGAR